MTMDAEEQKAYEIENDANSDTKKTVLRSPKARMTDMHFVVIERHDHAAYSVAVFSKQLSSAF